MLMFFIEESSIDIDWGAPSIVAPPKRFEEDELKLDWDDDDNNDSEEEEPKPSKPNHVQSSVERNLFSKSLSKDDGSIGPLYGEEGEEDLNNPHTMIAAELKLASCLKLMSEEIVNMAGQLEGTELRLHLYAWLEKQVPTLKEICKYTSDEDDLDSDEWNTRDRSLTPRLDTQGSGLHDIILTEKLDLEWKMGVITRRSRWLRANRHLLATLLAFARLHAHALAPVHIELVFLFDELQKEKSTGTGPSLVSPLPFLHSEFPLLSAVANPAKTAVSFIQSSARDILQTIAELIAIPVFHTKKEEEDAASKKLAAELRKPSVADSSFGKKSILSGGSETGMSEDKLDEQTIDG